MLDTLPQANLEALRPALLGDVAGQRLRQVIVQALHASGGGHFGGCLSCVDILRAIGATRPLRMVDGQGDRLLLSKGHAAMSLYALLQEMGVPVGPLSRYGSMGSPLQGHPDRQHLPCLDFSFGSLGQGVAVGLGMALATPEQHVWVVVGDGECQEGMVWEAAMLAARHQVANLHVIVDVNGEQECGWATPSGLDTSPLPQALEKWRAFGWQAQTCDGFDVRAMSQLIGRSVMATAKQPHVLLAQTHKQWGQVLSLTASRRHFTRLTDEEWSVLNASMTQDRK